LRGAFFNYALSGSGFATAPPRKAEARETDALYWALLRRKKLLHRANDASKLALIGNARKLTKLKSSAKPVLWPIFQSRKGVMPTFILRASDRRPTSSSGPFNSLTA